MIGIVGMLNMQEACLPAVAIKGYLAHGKRRPLFQDVVSDLAYLDTMRIRSIWGFHVKHIELSEHRRVNDKMNRPKFSPPVPP